METIYGQLQQSPLVFSNDLPPYTVAHVMQLLISLKGSPLQFIS